MFTLFSVACYSLSYVEYIHLILMFWSIYIICKYGVILFCKYFLCTNPIEWLSKTLVRYCLLFYRLFNLIKMVVSSVCHTFSSPLIHSNINKFGCPTEFSEFHAWQSSSQSFSLIVIGEKHLSNDIVKYAFS